MRGIMAIFQKEFRTQLQYKVYWLNMSLTPFLITAPYVLTGKSVNKNLEGMVLVGVLMWYWMNQYFFALGNAFSEERENGTLVSIIMSPMSIMEFLIGKGLWVFVQCAYITAITMILFKLVGVAGGVNIYMFFVFCNMGFYMFAFSIFFSALVLYFKRLSSLNYIIQQGLGLFSGITVDVRSYPKMVQLISNLIPLTFAIKIGRYNLGNGDVHSLLVASLILLFLSIVYFLIGVLMIKKVEKSLRHKGEWETW